MSTIQDLFQQAQLAEAAYADFSLTRPLKTALTDTTTGGSFSTAQATAFVADWRVVDQYTAPSLLFGVGGTGFSGTLFQNIQTGQYQFSLRGTEPGAADLSADIGDIVVDGLALDQIIDMYNYWQSLTHTGVYQAAKLETSLLETAALNLLLPGLARDAYIAYLRQGGAIIDDGLPVTEVRYVTTNNNSDTLLAGTPLALGSGKLAATASVNVDGHSLGGHLAMAFSRLFPAATTDVVAVNGAGFDYADPNVNILFSKLGGVPGFDAGKITNAVGSAAMNLVSQDWLFLQQPAGRTEIYTESAGAPAVFGHGSGQMTDSLSIYNLFAKLDPTLNTVSADNLAKITGLIKAGSNDAANSLEYTLDALRTLLQTGYTLGSPNVLASATAIDDRESLYTNLQSLQTSLANSSFNLGTAQAPEYGFTLLALAEAAGGMGLAAAAKTDLATRYALYQGNTFVLDATGYNLYATINGNGSLDLYNPATHSGELTGQYLADRAAFVLAKLKANTDDATVTVSGANIGHDAAWAKQGGEEVIYLDKTASMGTVFPGFGTAEIYQGNNTAGILGYTYSQFNDIKQIQFGSILNDTLTGGNKADSLYGMRGNDTLQGGKGNDYLEGGQGTDTYKYFTGDGLDTILDTDGNGSIVMDGAAPLAGGDQYGDARVHKDTGGHTYVDVSSIGGSVSGVVIDGKLFVQNWQAGNLGINMTGPAADINPTTTRDIYGDLAPLDTDPAHQLPDGLVHAWTNDLGNLLVGAASPNRADTLYDSAGNDHIVSGGGNDTLHATRGGDDLIEAGAGRDTVFGGAGKDVIIGGADGDILDGGDDNDRLYADTRIDAAAAIAQGNILNSGTGLQGDWLAGGAGDDTLVGSTARDVLTGGDGTDLLIGGAGNDDIMGDTDWVASSLDWTVTDLADGTRYFYPINSNAQPTVGAADVIYAGEGDDHVWGDLGNDVIFGEGGSDKLYGEGGSDIILGGAGIDYLYGDGVSATAQASGNDYLDGGLGDDFIYGNAGDDILIGGKQNDFLNGGAGTDTYIYNVGDGIDHIYDSKAERNILRFGTGVDKNNIKLHLGSLLLDLGNGDAVHIDNFDRNDAFNSSSIGSFEFADGTTLSTAELLARGFDTLTSGIANDEMWKKAA